MLNELDPMLLASLLSCLVTEASSGGGGKGSSGGGKGGGGKGGGGQGGGGKGSCGPSDAASLIRTPTMVEPYERLRDLAQRIATEAIHLQG